MNGREKDEVIGEEGRNKGEKGEALYWHTHLIHATHNIRASWVLQASVLHGFSNLVQSSVRTQINRKTPQPASKISQFATQVAPAVSGRTYTTIPPLSSDPNQI